LASLRSVWCGGESVPGQLASQFYQILSSSSVEFVNVYGPTECTILTTYHRVTKADIDRDVLPIGRPLLNYSCCILNENFVPVQQGLVGELFVGGEGVFRGYLTNGSNEDVARLNSLNARALVDIPSLQSPSNKNSHNKFYRTGDLCRLNDVCEIIFVGRVDHQVKLRGQRLELGEIEACISAVPLVTYCVAVKCCDQANQHEFLAAYVQCSASTPTSLSIKEAIQQRCRAHLAAYMVPTVVVLMDKLPLNVNGKVDRNQLPVPKLDTQFGSKYVEYKYVLYSSFSS
jgi:acyl-coenzyme A synthetase/AMP-(fatty) acid ligase